MFFDILVIHSFPYAYILPTAKSLTYFTMKVIYFLPHTLTQLALLGIPSNLPSTLVSPHTPSQQPITKLLLLYSQSAPNWRHGTSLAHWSDARFFRCSILPSSQAPCPGRYRIRLPDPRGSVLFRGPYDGLVQDATGSGPEERTTRE